jgi:hypothetical protein
VYMQPVEPKLSDIIVACKEMLSKVEGTCEQVDIYFHSCCWKTGDLLPEDVRSRIETESQNVKFTSWEKFNRALPWHQESDEEKRRVAVMEEHHRSYGTFRSSWCYLYHSGPDAEPASL